MATATATTVWADCAVNGAGAISGVCSVILMLMRGGAGGWGGGQGVGRVGAGVGGVSVIVAGGRCW